MSFINKLGIGLIRRGFLQLVAGQKRRLKALEPEGACQVWRCAGGTLQLVGCQPGLPAGAEEEGSWESSLDALHEKTGLM